MAKTTSTPTTQTRKRQGKTTPEPRLQSQIPNPKSQITSESLQSAIQLLPYQRRWIDDNSPLKIVVKGRQIGYSFASTLRVVFECLKKKTTWILLSKGERQSRLLMEKVQEHIQTCGIVAQAHESDYFDGTSIKQLETRFPNGSVIYGLPANPDTARGYSGNVTLDEFAFHADAEKIYSALYPSITRGYSLEVISTPNGQQGKFYDLARQAGLTEQVPGARCQVLGEKVLGARCEVRGSSPGTSHLAPHTWSSHYCDIYEAVRQGLKINLPLLRAGCEDDSAWQQEFCCQFISTAENFFSPELLAACLSAEASPDTPTHLLARESDPARTTRASATGALNCRLPIADCRLTGREFYLGIDIGRRHDRTVFWVDEVMECGSRGTPGSAVGLPLSSRPGLPGRAWELTAHEGFRSGMDSRSLRGEQAPQEQSGGKPPHSIAAARRSITRVVRTLANVPFDQQLATARELLCLREGNGTALIRRAAIDATGMGAPLAESLTQEFGARVEPVVFTAAVKEDLAYRTKRRMENGLTLLPDSREVRRAFSAVKKFVTVSGNVRFDAARTDAGHSDEFWAKALADLAAETQPAAHISDGYLADGKPLISPNAFMQTDGDWAASLARMVF